MKLKTILLSFLSLFCFFLFYDSQISASEIETKLIPNVDFVPKQLELFDEEDSTFITGYGTYQLFNEFDYELKEGEFYKFVFKINQQGPSYPSLYPLGVVNSKEAILYDNYDKNEKLVYYVLPSQLDERIILHLTGDARFLRYSELEVFVVSVRDEIVPSKITNVQYVFNEDNSITYTFDFPTDSDFSHLEIYQGSNVLNEKFTNNSIKITDLVPLMNYTFKFISVDKSGNKSEPYESIITMPEGPDLIPPLDITNLKHVVSDSSVQFTYSLPIDDDFSHLQIYRGNDLIADNVKIASFTDENLDFETSYKYIFKSVDFTGNISNGSTLTIKTMPYNDEIAPSAPSGLVVTAGNSSLYFNWLGNSENDLAGYNVYVDGIKKNGALINSVSYRLTNLVNNQEYTIQVSAVDTSGNESVLSDVVVGVPDVSKLPIFKVDNDLKPVAESVESWFSALWLPIAFSSGITLAFIVGRRIKALFFA